MLLSAVSVLAVAQSSSEIPEGLMYNPVYIKHCHLNEMVTEGNFWPAGIFVVCGMNTGSFNSKIEINLNYI